MRTFILACFLFYFVETGRAVLLAHRHARKGNGLEREDKSLLALWTKFFKKNTVSNNHKRTIHVNGSAWHVSLVLDKKASSNRTLVNTSDDVCKGHRESGGWNVVSLKYQSGTMCFAGEGFETRARSAVIMIEMALKILHENKTTLANFDHKSLHIGDMADCEADFAYSLPWDVKESCRTILVPDFTFWAWPEAGLSPNFKTIVKNLHQIQEDKAPQLEKCGWAGNPRMSQQRPYFIDTAKAYPDKFEFITPDSLTGTGGGRISMENQARRWACVIDLPAFGFSGRVPMLLHTGRPLLSLERSRWGGGHFTDKVWYAKKLIAGLHYLPVNANLTNLEATAKLALSDVGRRIGEQGLKLAQQELTTEKAINGLAIALTAR